MPLVIGSRVVAVVQLEFSRGANVHAPTIANYLFVLGPRAAQALDRTWQYESAQRARAEAETLRARADEELEGHQQTEVALRASEARYRTLAARTNRAARAHRGAVGSGHASRPSRKRSSRQGKIAVGATSGEVALLDRRGRGVRDACTPMSAASMIRPARGSRPRPASAPHTSVEDAAAGVHRIVC